MKIFEFSILGALLLLLAGSLIGYDEVTQSRLKKMAEKGLCYEAPDYSEIDCDDPQASEPSCLRIGDKLYRTCVLLIDKSEKEPKRRY